MKKQCNGCGEKITECDPNMLSKNKVKILCENCGRIIRKNKLAMVCEDCNLILCKKCFDATGCVCDMEGI